MKVTRRDFLKYLGVSAATLGLSGTDMARLRQVLANPAGPSVIWLQGAGCTGCSESFLNRISTSTTEPKTAADVLINSINLMYHPTLMSLAGEDAVDQAEAALQQGRLCPGGRRWGSNCLQRKHLLGLECFPDKWDVPGCDFPESGSGFGRESGCHSLHRDLCFLGRNPGSPSQSYGDKRG